MQLFGNRSNNSFLFGKPLDLAPTIETKQINLNEGNSERYYPLILCICTHLLQRSDM